MSLNTHFKPHTFNRSRLVALLVAMVLSMGLVACGDDDTPQDNNAADANNENSDAGHADAEDGTDEPDGGDVEPDGGNVEPDGGDVDPTPIEIAGIYDSDYGSVETITGATWEIASEDFSTIIFRVDSFDNAQNFAVTQNPEDADLSPNGFNRVVWTEPDETGAFFYCIIDFGRDTAEEAASSEAVADDTYPALGGCGGYKWTKLSPHVETLAIEIAGIYDNPFDGVETITDTTWKTEFTGSPATVSKIDSFDNTQRVAITQNPADAEFSPNAFNKIVWTEPSQDGVFFYCTVDFGLDTADEALASVEVADASDPANSGCGGFAWSELTPQ